VRLGSGSRLESIAPLAYASKARRALERLGARTPFDVVHWLFPGEPEEALFAPGDRTPFVIGPLFSRWTTGRGRRLQPGDAVKLALRPVERRRHRAALETATVLLATPDARNRGRVLAPGVDPARFRVTPAAGRSVAFVGRLERAKGVRELVEAFAGVVRAHPDATLVVAGDGSERTWIERRSVELGIVESVRLLGRVPADDVPAVLSEAAALCLPSRGEPYGMAVLEAMAAARAVVATDAGGPRHIVPADGGRLVPVGDAEALSQALISLLDDPCELAAMGLRNRQRVERELSVGRMLDRLEDVYAEVAA